MKRRFHEHSRSAIYSWILSYLLLTLVTVVLTGIVYVIARNTIETEINSANRLLLENIRDNIDAALVDVDDLSLDILTSAEIQAASLLAPDGPRDSAFYYKLYKAAQSLNNYKIYKTPFQNYYIYLGNIDRVIRPGTVNFSTDYYGNYIERENFSYEQWLEVVGQLYYGDFVTLPFSSPQSDKNFELALVRSLPPISLKDAVTNIVIMMDFSDILSYGTEDRSLIVLDAENRVVAKSNPDMEFDPSRLPDMNENHAIFAYEANSQKEVLSYILSRKNDWKYITVTPEYVFWEKASFIRNIMWGEIVLCVLGMGLLSFYFVRRNYNILREITSFVRSKVRSETVWEGNEFHYIRRALSRSIEEKEVVESLLDRQALTLRANLLTSLLEGRELSVPLDELLASYDIHFPHRYFSVVAVYIEHVNRDLWLGDRDKDLEVYSLARFAVINVVEEILGRSGLVYAVQSRELILCVVNTPLSGADFHRTLEDGLKDAKDFIAQNLDIDLCIAVGGVHETADNIHLACNEVQSAIDYARVLGRGQTVFYDNMEPRAGGYSFYPFEKERRLLNYIRLRDREACHKVLDEIFGGGVDSSTPREPLRLTALMLSSNLLRGISADEELFGRSLEANSGLIGRIMKSKTTDGIRDAMRKLTGNIIEAGSAPRRGRGASLSDLVRKEILARYTESSLCIASIADTIGKTPYYISKLFKAETGGGILDFISKVRIDRAKELLQAGELTQEQIAEQVGFSNVRTFQRAFKKLEGVPPGKLRNSPGTHLVL